ncbi:unnamed protein product [Sphenostylis stenocarpa]|uniref:PRA1 family protein n=1 Tax=Sphenostylis stenocarpa TaxID=92480 RepID=A0AA86SX50_9FABA|nr:unnamed protein product [Sphenostylis stenocarpa]
MGVIHGGGFVSRRDASKSLVIVRNAVITSKRHEASSVQTRSSGTERQLRLHIPVRVRVLSVDAMSNDNPSSLSSGYSSIPSLSRATAHSGISTRRPWEEFLALRSFTLPYSLGEATLRIKRNLDHFRVNYAMIALIVLFLSLISHPISLIVFIAVFTAWFFLYFFRDHPVVVLHRALDDRFVLAALAAVTVAALVLTGVWLNVVLALLVAAVAVVLHAAFRSTEDLYVDELEASDGGLVSVVGGSPTKRSGYSRI